MKKAAVLLFLVFFAVSVQALSMTGLISLITEPDYIPPQEELIIVEQSASGEFIDKRLAQSADLFFLRALKTKALFGVGGIKSYESEFVLSLENVSERNLQNISLIETIPKEIAKNALLIRSDENFQVLKDDPIIKFSIGGLRVGEIKQITYGISRDLEEGIISEETFRQMPTPSALIPLEKSACVGIICNDFNPCTTDYCDKGECAFEEKRDGITCGEGMVCIMGLCAEEEKAEGVTGEVVIPEKPQDFTALIAVLVVVLIITAFILAVRYGKQKRG